MAASDVMAADKPANLGSSYLNRSSVSVLLSRNKKNRIRKQVSRSTDRQASYCEAKADLAAGERRTETCNDQFEQKWVQIMLNRISLFTGTSGSLVSCFVRFPNRQWSRTVIEYINDQAIPRGIEFLTELSERQTTTEYRGITRAVGLCCNNRWPIPAKEQVPSQVIHANGEVADVM